MSTRRCSTCGISYPNTNLHILCDVCRGVTSILTNVDPDADWKDTVKLKQAPNADPEDKTYWWRAEELYRAGLSYEKALLLAGYRDVDLHEAVALIGKAGGELAYEILT